MNKELKDLKELKANGAFLPSVLCRRIGFGEGCARVITRLRKRFQRGSIDYNWFTL